MARVETITEKPAIVSNFKPVLSEHILEIRYRPNPKVLDYRGTWAELTSKYMELSQWRITQDRIDIFDVEEERRAFIGFRNSGFVVRNSPTANYFSDQARKLFKFISDELKGFWNEKGSGKEIFVERIGMRAKTLTLSSGSFEDLVESFSIGYLRLTPKAERLLDAQLVDVGGPLNFKDKYGNFNTMSGPMLKDEISTFFPFADEEELPKAGLYIDIDYWEKPEKDIESQMILRTIRNFSDQVQQRYQQIATLILGV